MLRARISSDRGLANRTGSYHARTLGVQMLLPSGHFTKNHFAGAIKEAGKLGSAALNLVPIRFSVVVLCVAVSTVDSYLLN